MKHMSMTSRTANAAPPAARPRAVPDTARKLAAEFIGTAFLLATVVGSGIMAEQLAGGNVAIALLGNTIPTGAILVVLITMFGPISGAHFNPAVTAMLLANREISAPTAAAYIIVQIIAAIIGVWIAHLMFGETLLQFSQKTRSGTGQWISEGVATFGLVATILLARRANPVSVALMVGLYITAAYWFTASTSFANPAVTIARSLSNTFAGIEPGSIPAFIASQFVGALLALLVCNWMLKGTRPALAS